MSLASANLVQLRYIPEAEFGVTPNSGDGVNLRMTGESLSFDIQTTTSQELRSDRQVTDLVLTSASAAGGFNFELSYAEYDPFIEAVLQGTWAKFGTNGVGATAAVTINSTAGTLTWGSAPTGANALTGLAVGQWFRLNAPSDAADGAWLQVGSRTSTVITVAAVTPIPGTGERTNVANVSIATARVSNGVTQRSFTLEREHADVDQFFAFRGMTANKMSIEFQSGNLVSGSFDFMGKDSVRDDDSMLPGTPVASKTFGIANAVNGVGNLLENGAPLTGTYIMSLSLNVDNALRAQEAIGTLGAVSVAAGTIAVTGSVEVYLADGVMYDKFVNNTATSLVWSVRDGSGNGYVFTIPKLKFSSNKVNAGGMNQDVMLSMEYTGILDPTTGKTIIIDRLGAAS